MKLPVWRSENIVVQEANKELLIYDLRINTAFCLNKTSTIIYRFGNGKTSFAKVQRRTGFSEDIILLALDQFKEDDLIEGEEIVFADDLNRRQVIRKSNIKFYEKRIRL